MEKSAPRKSEMDFAKRQLEKYGWQEGSGLGKHASGISQPLKPALKFDNSGIGHSSSEQFTNNWWETLYNKSSNNINVIVENDQVKLNVKDVNAVKITTKKDWAKTKNATSLEYGSFIKTSKLTESGIVNYEKKVESTKSNPVVIPALTDEQLFAACGGRTAHKAARHGLKLNGKLSRLEMQEKMLLKKLNKFSLSDENDTVSKRTLEKKLLKIKYYKTKNRSEEDMDVLPPSSPCILNVNSPHKSNKKRKGKHVSFSETVVEYQSQETDPNESLNNNVDLDSSSQSETSTSLSPVIQAKEVKINDIIENGNEMITELDEGIDCNDHDFNKEKTKQDLLEKIRNENKRMRKKLKKLRKLNKIQETATEETVEATTEYNTAVKWAKRKLFEEPEVCDDTESKCCHCECSQKLKKKQKMSMQEQKQFQKNLDKVANSFDNVCKISDVKSE